MAKKRTNVKPEVPLDVQQSIKSVEPPAPSLDAAADTDAKSKTTKK